MSIAPHPSEPSVEQTFGLPEEAVAELVGVNRDEIRRRRGPQGLRWAYGANRRVLWCAAGVQALQEELGPKNGGPVAPEALPCAPATLTVVGCRFPNQRVLIAHRGDSAERLTVYLGANGDNTLFLPGMTILARPLRGAAWLFEGNPAAPEKGRRMPRAVGRW